MQALAQTVALLVTLLLMHLLNTNGATAQFQSQLGDNYGSDYAVG
jgi:hypothetical protein